MLGTGIAAVLLAAALEPTPTAEEAAVARAEAAFDEQQYAEAADAFEDAYTANPLPRYLWAGAQAERLAGDCAAAIDLYDRFLATGPSEKNERDATNARQACADELDRKKHPAKATAPEGPAPSPATPSTSEPAPATDTAGKQAKPEPKPRDRERPPLAWYRDPWGGALVGSGVFVGGIGIGLLVSAVRLDKDAADASTEGAYESSRDDAVLRQRVGIATVAIGSALVVSGVVRWIVVGTRGHRRRAALSPTPGGVVLTATF